MRKFWVQLQPISWAILYRGYGMLFRLFDRHDGDAPLWIRKCWRACVLWLRIEEYQPRKKRPHGLVVLERNTTSYKVLQRTSAFYNAEHCSVLHRITAYYSVLQCTTAYYIALQHGTTYYHVLF